MGTGTYHGGNIFARCGGLNVGESCDSNSVINQCRSGEYTYTCINDQCGLPPGNACNQDNQCANGEYTYTCINGQCGLPVGHECSNSNQCANGYAGWTYLCL